MCGFFPGTAARLSAKGKATAALRTERREAPCRLFAELVMSLMSNRGVKNSPLVKGGQRHCDGSRCAAWGLSCELEKPNLSSPGSIVWPSSLSFRVPPDNPRRLWRSPFSKGEFLPAYSDTPSKPRVS